MDHSVTFERSTKEPPLVGTKDIDGFSAALPIPAATSYLKRLLDIVLASMLLVFLGPVLLSCALLIKLDSKGGVFFLQRRTGLNGQSFRIIKFRTMSVSEDGDVVVQAQKVDKRVTRVGGFLRRASVDELPQLINVLRGEMSLVGPRPHALAHDAQFASLVPNYFGRFRVRPGITGLAQVRGFRGEVTSVDQIALRVQGDNDYVEAWSIFLDIKILLVTLAVVPFQKTAY